MPNKEVSNDYDYKIQGKGNEPTINAIEILEQKLPEYVMKYRSSWYDEIESVIEKKYTDNFKHNSFLSHAFEL